MQTAAIDEVCVVNEDVPLKAWQVDEAKTSFGVEALDLPAPYSGTTRSARQGLWRMHTAF
jgi:hypothetical protein